VLLDEHLLQRHGRTGYILREGLARLGGGGRDFDGEVNTEAAVRPAQHVPGQPFVEQSALEKEGDHAGAEVLAEPVQIEAWHMDEPPLPVESAFEENGVQVRIPPGELTRGGVGDDGGALDLSAGCFVVESLDHAIDELADLPVEPSVVAKENAEHLGKREDHLPVRKQEQ